MTPAGADALAWTAAAGTGSVEPPAARHLAVVDILDRDGQVRQTQAVHAWPLTIGRALDNQLVLTDPHVAAHHLAIEPDEAGELMVAVADTVNGVWVGRQHLRQGERGRLAAMGQPSATRRVPAVVPGAGEMTVGRTRLRLHLPGEALAPELPLAGAVPPTRRLVPIVIAAAVLLAMQLASAWLGNDADGFGRAAGVTVLTALAGAVVWCGAWSLLSKTFTRQAHFGWHLKVFLFGSIGLLLLNVVPAALAFAFSWPAATDFAFIGSFIVGGIVVYHHLLAVEPARPRLLRGMVATGVLAGIALTFWLNLSRTDLWGDELYMSHLFPPALRMAKPVSADHFIAGLSALQPVLDKKAKETDSSDPGPSGGDEAEGDGGP